MTSGNELYDKPEMSHLQENPYTGFGATSSNHPVFNNEAFDGLCDNDDPDHVYSRLG